MGNSHHRIYDVVHSFGAYYSDENAYQALDRETLIRFQCLDRTRLYYIRMRQLLRFHWFVYPMFLCAVVQLGTQDRGKRKSVCLFGFSHQCGFRVWSYCKSNRFPNASQIM